MTEKHTGSNWAAFMLVQRDRSLIVKDRNYCSRFDRHLMRKCWNLIVAGFSADERSYETSILQSTHSVLLGIQEVSRGYCAHVATVHVGRGYLLRREVGPRGFVKPEDITDVPQLIEATICTTSLSTWLSHVFSQVAGNLLRIVHYLLLLRLLSADTKS